MAGAGDGITAARRRRVCRSRTTSPFFVFSKCGKRRLPIA